MAPYRQTSFDAYDSYGRLTQSTEQSSGGSPWQIVHKTWYVWDDAVSPSVSGSSGEYVIDRVAFSDTEDVSGTRYACASTAYSGVALSFGNVNIGRALPTTQTTYASGCGAGTATNPIATTAPTGALSTTLSYDGYGNTATTKDPEGTAGNAAHLGCAGPNTATTCASYDATFQTLPIQAANALGQPATTGYGNTTTPSLGGFGLWPTAYTDANSQTTSVSYDALGRVSSLRLPGEAAAFTKQWGYTVWCAALGAATPCIELDETQRLDSSTTVMTRSFYDGLGHLIETRKPGPSASGNDIVQFNQYDTSGRVSWASIPYFVPAYTGAAGAAAFATPDITQPHTTTTYDGLDRVKTVTDPLGHVTTTSYTVGSAVFGVHGGNGDLVTTTIDANGHKTDVWTDPFGRTNIVRTYTGNSPATYALYAQTQQWYTYQGPLATIVHPDGTTLTTFSYDLAGRKTGMTDPDSGTWTYAYDADGNLTQQSDGRGAAGTLYAGYDGLNRQLWRNSTNTPTGAYVTYSYDSTLNGNQGIGRLTGESFNGGAGGTALGAGSYASTYDGRGQRSGQTITLGGTAYSFAYAYNDAGQPTTTTYSDGEVEALSYDATGLLAGATTTPGGGTATTLANALTYTGTGGAFGHPTGASVGGGVYTFAASFDTLDRLTSSSLSRVSPAATLFSSARGYDAVGNVTSVSTTLPTGTDNQAFCYDEQNRLTWASSATGSPPCGGTLSAGTLTTASYTQSFAYDTFGRLTSGPLGSYSYGPGMQAPAPAIPSPLHAALAAGSSYTATYDATGNMLCRAPTTAAGTCTTSTATGQPLSYDTEGRLTHWQNLPGASPTSTAAFAYDGEGQRVAYQTVSSSTTTTTLYVGGLEEVATTTTTGTGGNCTTFCCPDCGGGGTTTTTTLSKYLSVPGVVTAERVGTTLSYLASDGLGSESAALDGSGNLTAAQLFAPYGSVRYSTGTMPTAKGYTGQRADAVSGLDYYVARYYDPALGQFTSADTVLPGDGADPWGLSRYAYVEGNPLVRVDPTGHADVSGDVWQFIQTEAASWWDRMTDPSTWLNYPTVVTGLGAFAFQALPQGLQYLDQASAIKTASKGLNNAGQDILSKTRFSDRPDVLQDLLSNQGYQSKSYQTGSRGMRQTDNALAEARTLAGDAADMKGIARWGGRVMLGFGALLDFGSTYSSYVGSHPDDPHAQIKGLAYGGLHAGLSTLGGLAGASLGMMIPIPGVDVVAAFGLSYIGSASGDWLADQIQNGIDGGGIQQTWSNATNTVSGWAGNVSGAAQSFFGGIFG